MACLGNLRGAWGAPGPWPSPPQGALACHDMPRHAMPCFGMPWHALACLGMPWHVLACLGMPWHVFLSSILVLYSRPVFLPSTSCSVRPRHAVSVHVRLCPKGNQGIPRATISRVILAGYLCVYCEMKEMRGISWGISWGTP